MPPPNPDQVAFTKESGTCRTYPRDRLTLLRVPEADSLLALQEEEEPEQEEDGGDSPPQAGPEEEEGEWDPASRAYPTPTPGPVAFPLSAPTFLSLNWELS